MLHSARGVPIFSLPERWVQVEGTRRMSPRHLPAVKCQHGHMNHMCMTHAPASSNSPSCRSQMEPHPELNLQHRPWWPRPPRSSCLRCCSLQFTVHAVGHGPHAKIQFLSLALKVLPSVATWISLLPRSSSPRTTYYPARPGQLLPAVSPLFRLCFSSPCFRVGSAPSL